MTAPTYTVGPKGQVVLPRNLRAALGLEPGDEVTVSREGDHLTVHRAAPTTPLRGRFAGGAGHDLPEDLTRGRASDRAREDRR